MKYYIPTTTLNFTSIASSLTLAPAGVYGTEQKLWWNRFLTCVPNPDERFLVLYDCIPEWQIPTSNNMDYPLVVEWEHSSEGEVAWQGEIRNSDGNGSTRFRVVSSPVFLKEGHFRFIFRNDAERHELLARLTGVPEFKGMLLGYEPLHCTTVECVKGEVPCFEFTDLAAQAIAKAFLTMQGTLKQAADRWGRVERRQGARLGFRVGCWLKELKKAPGVFASQPPLSSDWPLGEHPAFAAVLKSLEDICGDNFPMDREGRAVLSVRIWKEALLPSVNEGNAAVMKEHFNRFLANLQDPLANAYDFAKEESPLIQALAGVFYAIDKDFDALVGLLKSNSILRPEYLMSFYGAAKGYTRFAANLLQKETYESPKPLPPAPPPPPPEPRGGHFTILTGIAKVFGRFFEDSALADYLEAWAVIHGIANPEELALRGQIFQDNCRSDSQLRELEQVISSDDKTLIADFLKSIKSKPSRKANWTMTAEEKKLLKVSLEFRYGCNKPAAKVKTKKDSK